MAIMKSALQIAYERTTHQQQPQSFSGAVEVPLEIEMPAPPSPAQKPESSADILERLASISTRDAQRRAAIHGLVIAATSLLDRIAHVERECDAERTVALRNEHKDVRAAGRQLLKQIEKLSKEAGIAMREWNEALVAQGKLVAAMRTAKQDRSSLSRWATDEEIQQADDAIVTAQKETQTVVADVAEHNQRYNALQSDMVELRNEMAKLGADEERLRKRLEGKSFIDPELGLESL